MQLCAASPSSESRAWTAEGTMKSGRTAERCRKMRSTSAWAGVKSTRACSLSLPSTWLTPEPLVWLIGTPFDLIFAGSTLTEQSLTPITACTAARSASGSMRGATSDESGVCSRSLSNRRSGFPEDPFGIDSTSTSTCGKREGGRRLAAKSRSCEMPTRCGGARATAIASCRTSCGVEKATTSPTHGWSSSASSISRGDISSPPRIMTSFARPVTNSQPSLSIRPRSPRIPALSVAVTIAIVATEEQLSAADQNLARRLLSRQRAPTRVDDPHCDASHRPAHTARLLEPVADGWAGDGQALGHAIAGHDGGRRTEQACQLHRVLIRQVARGGADEPQMVPRARFCVRWSLAGAAKDERPRGRHQMAPGDGGCTAADFCEEAVRIEAIAAHDRAARDNRCEEARDDPGNVAQRKQVQANVVLAQLKAAAYRRRRRAQPSQRQWHAFRCGGRA
eukprot:7382933-Prymnesium_polylepis.1